MERPHHISTRYRNDSLYHYVAMYYCVFRLRRHVFPFTKKTSGIQEYLWFFKDTGTYVSYN